ncbi:hypothetical protein DDE83_002310 [Stemphylium lycopersici]|uniref:Uncharacterized protein n=1 Tax=Stemphylium lycopersici TaxID=183478 RepID=A0A364NAU9_STELY|nr:hypothetical protein DDE83_002310 [Stemphylium lycopersici]
MTTFAPPARRGDFLYSSILYADPGNGSHHARASVAELAALLRPEAPNLYSKGRKPEVVTPAKDPVWHFYSAQLIHYGLPVTKDKNAAKVRLLNAMNQFKLEVPAWVLKVESELKAEWEAANRKLKKSSGTKGSKRTKASGDSLRSSQSTTTGVNVNVSVTLSTGISSSEYQETHPASNDTPRKPLPAKRKRADSKSSSSAAKLKKTTRVKKEPMLKKSSVKKEPEERRSHSTVKQEYRSQASPSTPSRSRVKQEPHSLDMHRYARYSSPLLHPYDDDEYDYEPSFRPLLSGIYDIECQTASDLFQDYDLTLTLSRSPYQSIWWATFRWGAWDGLIQMNPGPTDTNTLGEPCSLGWRLRDLETGQLTFGRKCTGSITFWEDGQVYGWLGEMPGVGKLDFMGNRVSGSGPLEADLKAEWDLFVEEAYRR